MATVIIPAHNEGSVLGATLASLLPQLAHDDEVIVVSNGSSDDTVQVAGGFGAPIQVLSTPVASKTHALNLGDQHASSYPRIYLDADVRLAPGALARIKASLASGTWLAAAPGPEMDFETSSGPVKAYYRIWLSLPYCQRGMMGAGAYALSASGRRRFERFPDLIADDGYVRALFEENERGKVPGASSIVRAPANLHWLLKIKTRSRLGQMQLAREFPELVRNEQKDYGRATLRLLANPLNWPGAVVYLYVALVTKARAKRQLSQVVGYTWEKDHSTRRSIPEQPT